MSDVFNMEGGIRAWEGLVAEGTPDAGMALFPNDATAGELVWLSWQLEEGSRRFYAGLSDIIDDPESRKLLKSLETAEEHHKERLMRLREEVAEPGENPFGGDADIMEGGMSVSKAVSWATDRPITEVLELLLSLEANAYDLYLRLRQRMTDSASQRIFSELAEEEKQHLGRLAELLDRKA